MATYRETIAFETKPGVQAINLTDRVAAIVKRSEIRDGLACILTPSSTSAIVANEFEPGLMTEDVPAALERLFPEGASYGHERRWHDGNGHSHVRATFLGQSLTIPVMGGEPGLGTWQQVAFLELDNKPRRREVIVQLVGDEARPRD
jgi:secondary thiamine-phosphate synthase enzyme